LNDSEIDATYSPLQRLTFNNERSITEDSLKFN